MSRTRFVLTVWYLAVAAGLLFYVPPINRWQYNFIVAVHCPVCPVCVLGVPPSGFGPIAALLNGFLFATILAFAIAVHAFAKWVFR